MIKHDNILDRYNEIWDKIKETDTELIAKLKSNSDSE